MSRAFVREGDGDEPPPERAVSPHPNLVTARGLAALEARHIAPGCLKVTLATHAGASVSFRLREAEADAAHGLLSGV